MVEISRAAPTPDQPAEDLDLFRRAIEKAGKLSLPSRTVSPRGVAATQARLHHHAARPDISQPQSVLIGNWFWNIG